MRMVTVCATTWTTVWVPSMPVASAMGPAKSMNVVAPESPRETATAMETSSTPWASVEVPALPIPMATACAITQRSLVAQTRQLAISIRWPPKTMALAFTTMPLASVEEFVRATKTTMESVIQKTPALAHWMCAVFAMGLERFIHAVAKKLRQVRATATAIHQTPSEFVTVTVTQTKT